MAINLNNTMGVAGPQWISGGITAPPTPAPTPMPMNALDMLIMRLRWGHYDPISQMYNYDAGMQKFEYIHAHVSKDKVIVFSVKDNTSIVLEDTTELYPSDTLVTQVRMLAP